MLKKVVSKFSKITLANAIRDDDIVDQLHHHAMVATLIILAVAVTGRQFVGGPIHCWLPAQYKEDDQRDYVNSVCWISQIYNVPLEGALPVSREERMSDDKDVSFYRWASVILFIQALMFELPHLFWRNLKGFSGVNLKKVVAMCLECSSSSLSKSGKHVSDIAYFIDKWLQTYRRFTRSRVRMLSCLNKHSGCYLVRLYLFTKLMYLANVLAQFHILSLFLGFNYWRYGVNVVQYLTDDAHWSDLDHFPRIGMCDLEIRQLQNLHIYTVQCVLSVNLFLEKIFAGMWFVLVFLSAITTLNTLSWFSEEILTSRRESFIQPYLHMINEERKREHVDAPDTRLFKKFVRSYLRYDGVFLLRIISINTNDNVAFDLLKQLWTSYEKEHQINDLDFDSNTPQRTNGLRQREHAV